MEGEKAALNKWQKPVFKEEKIADFMTISIALLN